MQYLVSSAPLRYLTNGAFFLDFEYLILQLEIPFEGLGCKPLEGRVFLFCSSLYSRHLQHCQVHSQHLITLLNTLKLYMGFLTLRTFIILLAVLWVCKERKFKIGEIKSDHIVKGFHYTQHNENAGNSLFSRGRKSQRRVFSL